MCLRFENISTGNVEYFNDLRRGRFADGGFDRFYRLEAYARRRWALSKELRYSRQWIGILDAIKRRKGK